MKIRNSFISNSSSSSFVAVLTYNKEIIDQILEKLNITKDDFEDIEYGNHKDFDVVNYGILQHQPTKLDMNICNGYIEWIGLQIFSDLRVDKTVSECKQKLQKILSELGINLDVKQIKFICDECNS